MTAIQPSDSTLRDLIDSDEYNSILNEINSKYAEMEKFIGNLESDISSIRDFEKDMLADQERGYNVGTSIDTLVFQEKSLQIDLDFFVNMKNVYIKKLYGDLHQYCSGIIDNALAIEEIPQDTTREQVKERKFRNMKAYPMLKKNPVAFGEDGSPIPDIPPEIVDTSAKYEMNDIFALINCTTSNLRELAGDIGTFSDRIANATEKESRGFSVGNLIMNLESQKQKLTLEFTSYIERLGKFLEQNKKFSGRCLNRIKIISEEIVTAEETAESTPTETTTT
jgi:hypothetical protein